MNSIRDMYRAAPGLVGTVGALLGVALVLGLGTLLLV